MSVFKKVLSKGIVEYFSQHARNYEYQKESEKALELSKNFGIFQDVLMEEHNNPHSDFDIINTFGYISFCRRNNIDLIKKHKFLKDIIYDKFNVENLSDISAKFIGWSTSEIECSAIVSICSATKNYDWSKLVSEVLKEYSIQEKRCYYTPCLSSCFVDVLMEFAKSDSKGLLDYLDKIKSFNYSVRALFAKSIAASGLLDQKQARKYRSECQSVSMNAIRGLNEGREMYSSLDFNKLVYQFADSKHSDVVFYMQKNLPVENLSVLFANPLASHYILNERISKHTNQ